MKGSRGLYYLRPVIFGGDTRSDKNGHRDPTDPYLPFESDNLLFKSLDALLVLCVLIFQRHVVLLYGIKSAETRKCERCEGKGDGGHPFNGVEDFY